MKGGGEMTSSEPLKRTPLFDRHVAMGARVVEFGGWEMPVQYSGIVDEHNAVRHAAGLFDISHMGEVEVKGPGALAFLQHIATQDIAAIGEGLSNYSLMCHPNGGIVDDIFIYNLPDGYMVVVNASNTEKDFAWMLDNMHGFDIELTNISDRAAMLALQGPAAEGILAKATDIDAAGIAFHGVTTGMLLGDIPALIARTGYTGEDGFELFVDDDNALKLWDGLLELGKDAGLKPCGLGARDSLRFEACLPLYGHEIADDINPYEAKLGWVVKLDKGDFVGRAALQQVKREGVRRKLTGFEVIGRGIARGGYEIRDTSGKRIGEVTTGMPSPTLGKNYGLGYVPIELAREGSEFDVVVRDRPVRVQAVKTPFYQPRYKK
jgi:aminomethyltransferase